MAPGAVLYGKLSEQLEKKQRLTPSSEKFGKSMFMTPFGLEHIMDWEAFPSERFETVRSHGS